MLSCYYKADELSTEIVEIRPRKQTHRRDCLILTAFARFALSLCAIFNLHAQTLAFIGIKQHKS